MQKRFLKSQTVHFQKNNNVLWWDCMLLVVTTILPASFARGRRRVGGPLLRVLWNLFFSCLGETYNLDQTQKDEIEKFVCALYGKPKLKIVNEARAAIFWGKYNQSKKIADLSMLPPCQGNLMLHLKRANYVAYNMRHSCELRPIKEDYSHHGWTEDGRPVWVESLLPDDVENVLIEQEGTQNDADDESYLDEEEIHEFDDDNISLEDFS